MPPGTGVWDIGTLVAGATKNITITALVNQAGNMLNVASITASDAPDPDVSNNSSGVTLNNGVSESDLGIAKSVDNPAPAVLDNVTFTIALSNNGPGNTGGVVIADPLPAGLTYLSDTSGGAYNPVTGIWSVGALNAGSGAVLQITARVDIAGEIINTARITASSLPDPDGTNNESSAVVNPAAGHTTIADLAVQKTVSQPLVNIGSQTVFTVVVRNNGPADAADVVVNDLLPAGSTYVSSFASQGIYDNGSGVWTAGNIPAGSYVLLDIVTQVTSGGVHTNTAVASSMTTFDPNSSNNAGSASVSTTSADLSIVKNDNPDPVTASGTITYTIQVANNGPDTAETVAMKDTLPAGVIYVSASGSGWTCGYAAGVVTCGRTTLVVGSAPDITLVVTAPAGGGTIDNTATVSAATNDPDSGNNSATQRTTVIPPAVAHADLEVLKKGSPSPVSLGQNITYTLRVTNRGPDTAMNVVLVDTLPQGVAFINMIWSSGWTCGQTAGVVTCTRADLPVGAAPDITIVVAAPTQSGTVINTASVHSDTVDPDMGNNTSDYSTLVLPPAGGKAPYGVKSVNDNEYPELKWTMVWVNNGNPDTLPMRVTDVIPPFTTYVPRSLKCEARGKSTTVRCSYSQARNLVLWERYYCP